MTTEPTPQADGHAARRRSLLRSAGVMTVMTLVSRVLGLVREQVRALYLGTGAASDAFGLASTIPNLFRQLVAEGAMTAAFLPVFTEYLKKAGARETREFLSRFLTLLTLAVTGLTVLGIVLTPWIIETFFAGLGEVELTITLTQLMWPYLLFVTLAAAFQAILNAHKIFGPSAFTPVLLNLCIIGFGVALAHQFDNAAYGLVIGFVVGGVVQMAFQIPYISRHTAVRVRPDFHFRDPGVRRVLVTMAPGVFAAGIYQINVFVSQLIASTLRDGAIAALQYSIRLQELVLGLFVVSVAQVILPTLSEQTATDDREGVKDTLEYATGLMAFVTLPATLGLILVGPEIVRLLFQFGAFDARSTERTSFALYFHAAGLLAIALTRVYQQAFYAHKDLKTPTLVAAIVMVTNIVLCLVLAVPLEHGGIALAGSLAATLNGALLLWFLRRRLGRLHGRAIVHRVARLGVATAVMTVAVLGWEALWPADGIDSRPLLALWVLGVCGWAAVVYLVACRALKVDELQGVFKALARRFRRKKK